MNESLQQLHDLLLDQHDALSARMSATTDPKLARAILMEMQELLHRIDLVQDLLLKAASDALLQAVAAVKTADQHLTATLAAVTKVTDVVNAVSGFLSVVDKAIDLAKTLPAVA